ncbi:MAG: hypothetical protein FJX59_06650 [Alphaproteobacteria bacterium]|nr:hypothetical protein [Alphaproteobacteria bacterium]
MAETAPKMNAGGPPPLLLAAIEKLLTPLVRALIAFGVTFPLFIRLLKRVYVRVAAAEFRIAEREPTTSRISVLTGLQRRDIGAVTEQIEKNIGPPANISIGARLIGIWTGVKRFTDSDGRPAPLPRFEAKSGPTFEDLVRTVSSDVRPRAILDEWLRLGVVELDNADCVVLRADAFVPRRGFDELAYYYGRNLRDHIAASTHNLLGEGAPFLERAVYYDRLTPESVEALAKLSRELGVETLIKINREALKRADGDEKNPRATQRMSVGLYFFGGDDPAAADDHAKKK